MPKRGISKRKLKEQKSQRVKKPRKGAINTDILTPELLAELGQSGHDHADSLLVVQGSSKVEDPVKKTPSKPKLTKNEQRKLKQVEAKKARHQRLAGVFSVLSKNRLKDGEALLLRPIHKRGQKETQKELQARASKLHNMGVSTPFETRSVHKRRSDCSDSGTDTSDVTQEEATDNQFSEQKGLGRIANEEVHSSEPSHTSCEKQTLMSMEDMAERARMAKEGLDLTRDEIADEMVEDTPGKLPHNGPHRIVPVARRPEIDEARSKLPIVGMEQEIMETVSGYDVIVLCGQTGCGKTTQVPQFLFEAGYGCKQFPEKSGMIGITQPRRVAAISTANRVADEMNSSIGSVVGYQVRYDKSIGDSGNLKFMTDGILMRELQEDFLLRKYSVIIADEAHERSLNTDLLLGMLSRIVPLRRRMSAEDPSLFPLKLIIMSATLRKEDFVDNTRLFPTPPPVINVASRQYPVTVHFSKRTELVDYPEAAYRKTCRIHKELPPGGILVFVTGQKEVEHVCSKLRKTFVAKCSLGSSNVDEIQQDIEHQTNSDKSPTAVGDFGEDLLDEKYGEDAAEVGACRTDAGIASSEAKSTYSNLGISDDSDEEETHILSAEGVSAEEAASQERTFDETYALDRDNESGGTLTGKRHAPVYVLPLYALLSPEKQARVFKPPPDGSRLIVVATNVAETSITIPNIRFVVDAGRSKQKLLNPHAGVSKFEIRWISKAAAEQRAGRAGRTVPGHCYRLYSSAHFNDTFPEHTPPEIVNTPLEGVVLMMKSLGINKVVNFPFPTPPERSALAKAESALVSLSALNPDSKKISDMGMTMAKYPVTPRHSRMILEAMQIGEKEQNSQIVVYAIALAAAIAEQSPFIHIDAIQGESYDAGDGDGGNSKDRQSQLQKAAREAHDLFTCENSDAIGVLNVLCAYESEKDKSNFCEKNFMHARNLREVSSLFRQLARTFLRQNIPGIAHVVKAGVHLSPPDKHVVQRLRRAVAAGWCDQVARRVRSVEYLNKLQAEGKGMRAVRYLPCNSHEFVYMHPNSKLHKSAQEFVVYSELLQTEKRTYMYGVTVIDSRWLPDVAPYMCRFSELLDDPSPFYKSALDKVMCWRMVQYGVHDWETPPHSSPHPDVDKQIIHFGKSLLEGQVLLGFRELVTGLVVSPSTATRPETRYHARLGLFLHQLKQKKICCRGDLAAMWELQPDFLKDEIQMWLKKQFHAHLQEVWPRLLQDCLSV